MTSSYVMLAPVPTKTSPPVFDLTLLAPRSVPFKAGKPGSCWIPLLRESVLSCGFPIAQRDEGLGLEIPFNLMMYLSGVHYPVEYGQGIVFRSHVREGSGDYSMLVPTRKLETSVQWHFFEGATGASANDAERTKFLEDMANPNFWYQTKDIESLVECRAFLGYCSCAKVLIGSKEFNPPIRPSSLPKAGIDVNISLNDNVTFSGSAKGFFNIGMTLGYEVRRGQEASIPGGALDVQGLLNRAADQPLLLYDAAVHRAWLVPELSVALHMTHHLLARRDISSDIRTQLRFADATGHGGRAALDAIDKCRNVVLWKEGERDIRFYHKVMTFSVCDREQEEGRPALKTFLLEHSQPLSNIRGAGNTQISAASNICSSRNAWTATTRAGRGGTLRMILLYWFSLEVILARLFGQIDPNLLAAVRGEPSRKAKGCSQQACLVFAGLLGKEEMTTPS